MPRPLLYSREYVRGFANALREARADLHELHAKHLYELGELQRELAEVRGAYNLLRAVTLRRQGAEAEVRELCRERDIVRARAAERDWARPLH